MNKFSLISHEEVEDETSKEGHDHVDSSQLVAEHDLLRASLDSVETEHGEHRQEVNSWLEDKITKIFLNNSVIYFEGKCLQDLWSSLAEIKCCEESKHQLKTKVWSKVEWEIGAENFCIFKLVHSNTSSNHESLCSKLWK